MIADRNVIKLAGPTFTQKIGQLKKDFQQVEHGRCAAQALLLVSSWVGLRAIQRVPMAGMTVPGSPRLVQPLQMPSAARVRLTESKMPYSGNVASAIANASKSGTDALFRPGLLV